VSSLGQAHELDSASWTKNTEGEALDSERGLIANQFKGSRVRKLGRSLRSGRCGVPTSKWGPACASWATMSRRRPAGCAALPGACFRLMCAPRYEDGSAFALAAALCALAAAIAAGATGLVVHALRAQAQRESID
jgi:hypothetical protein